MAEQKIFVGRKDELERFRKVLEDPKGQAVLVVGQAGMGKTWLTHKMAEVAENHPDLKCGWVRYEVTPTDSVDSTMALMMDNAFEAAQVTEGSFDGTPRRIQQWKALLNIIKIGDLVFGLKHNPAKNTREQFLERFSLISKRMPKDGRAVFIIDPEKYMQEKSDQSWAIIVKQLPEKIKFVFAQRPEDELIKSNVFKGLANVVYIPEGKLDVLEEENVEDLVRLRADNVGKPADVLKEAVKQYEGHPYAIQAALDIVTKTKSVEALPKDPTPVGIAEAQWERISDNGDDTIRLFETYSILEVGVPDEVVEAVSTLKATTRKRLQRDSYLRGLLREEGEGRRIYHAILADYILGQIGEGERKEYHNRAMEVYREKLAEAKKKQTKPDALAAIRIAEHVLEAEGEEAFVDAFVNECSKDLMNLGLLNAAIGLSERALNVVKKGSEEEALLYGNLGVIYGSRGDLDKAEEMFIKILEIHEKLGHHEGMASDYGNLGNVYQIRGELDKAEEMIIKSLEIEKKIGRLEGIANGYAAIGLVCMDRGNLRRAEEMHLKGLEIEKEIGRLDGTARQYVNLGLIYQARGDLDKAEEMHKKSLEISEKLGLQKGVASSYGNLGLIYRKKGDLDKAEEMHKNSLEINKKLGRLQGIASQLGNLGVVYQTRGELDKAEEMHKRALEIEKKLGRLGGIANQYGNLGLIYRKRGELDKAEEMYKKVLEIEEEFGRPGSIARAYGNLGVVYQTRGKLDKAEEMYKKSLEISEKLGLQEGIANNYGNLGTLYEERGDNAKAREYWEKAVELFKKIGMPHEVEKVEGWINSID